MGARTLSRSPETHFSTGPTRANQARMHGRNRVPPFHPSSVLTFAPLVCFPQLRVTVLAATFLVCRFLGKLAILPTLMAMFSVRWFLMTKKAKQNPKTKPKRKDTVHVEKSSKTPRER